MKFHATGAGQAVVQLDVNYGVDYEPHKDIPPKVSFLAPTGAIDEAMLSVRLCVRASLSSNNEF